MHDWKAAVRERLTARRIDPTRHTSVIEELGQHLEDRHRSLVARGLSEAEAMHSVLQELDESDALRDELSHAERRARAGRPAVGEPGPGHFLERTVQDLRHAARALRMQPGFTSIATLTLALGIGVNAAIFSVVDAVMLRPLPFAAEDRLVRIFESNPARGWPEFSASDPNFLDWRAQATSWAALAASSGGTVSVNLEDGVEVVRGVRVTAEFLTALGVTPALGRDFRRDDDRQGGDPRVVILSDGLWRRVFGADPGVIGRPLRLNGTPHTVVGVLPPGFEWGPSLELLQPLVLDPTNSRNDHQLSVIGRLRADVPLESARAELTAIAARLAREYPADNEGWTVRLVTFYDWLIPAETRQSLIVLQGAVGLVLLIACVNVANLLLARGAARQKELAIRVAIGASRARILWHGALESLLLAMFGAAAGVGVAMLIIRLLAAYAPDTIPRIEDVVVNGRVLAFTVLLACVAALLAGLIPSLQAARERPSHVLHATGRGLTTGVERQRLRAILTIAEVALSVALLIGAGLLLRSFVSLQRVDPGFDVESVMTGRVMLGDRTSFDTLAKRVDFWRGMTDEIAGLPGIVSVSTGSGVPLTFGNTSTELAVPGVLPLEGVQPSADWRVVTPGYFKTMGMSLGGRDFSEADDSNGPPTIIVSEALAKQYWPNEDALGKIIVPRSLGNRPRTIIGIAGDVRSFGLDGAVRPMIYYSGFASPVFNPMYVVWRSADDPSKHVAAIRSAIRRVNPHVALYEVRASSDLLSSSFGARRFNLYLLGLFAAVALVLAAAGLFGVMAYLVSQRSREIGVRLALGANRTDILRLILGRGLALSLAGAVVGIGGALALGPVMAGLLFSVTATDPGTFVMVPLLLIAVALLACYVPARRAMRVDPVSALRAE